VESNLFIDINLYSALALFVVGFVGGMVSGFIGSGGAFVLTPAMMTLGVPGIVAVASNICHKFPKSLVGAMKRHKYGQVDVKLGVIMGIFAELGVIVGKHVMTDIKHTYGDVGTSLYVSVVFVIVLAVVGSFVLRDAVRMFRQEKEGGQEAPHEVTRLARWVQSIEVPGTMMYFDSLKARVSVLFIVPLGFATGMLAATIAVAVKRPTPGIDSKVVQAGLCLASSASSRSSWPMRNSSRRISSTRNSMARWIMPGIGVCGSAKARLIASTPVRAPCGTARPNSRQKPRRALIRLVRVPIHSERVRCSACKACCSTDLMRTGTISAQRAASSSASASAASVLLRFT